MTGKRPHEGVDDDGDSKRVRSNNGSPAPPAQNNSKAAALEKIAAMKAKIAAGKNGASAPPFRPAPPAAAPVASKPPPPPQAAAPNGAGAMDQDAKKAATLKKLAEIKARNAAAKAGGSPANGGQGAAPPQPSQKTDSENKMKEARENAMKRARELAASKKAQAPTAVPAPPPRQDSRQARGGLGTVLHPSLIGGDTGPAKATSGPKFSTTIGNQPAPEKANPYLADSTEAPSANDPTSHDPSLALKKPADRKSKQLIFNQKGKFIAQAAALKQQARMEEMKLRIAAETRKTEIEEAGDKAFLVPAPPEIEWWDEGLLPADQKTYESWDLPDRNRIETDDSIITRYIQHPVLLQAPQDRLAPAPKPMMLTQKEQKKLRRQKRMADMKEEQAKIRLGLIEPPPPKVKKSNMMRVLGEQAVKDPTAVEARVNREIAQRKNDHETANEERKLTKEQRAEKVAKKREEDEQKGVKMCVFRVEDLSSGKHRYQVDVNAKQHALNGIVVLHPDMNLIIVEGGDHDIKAFRKLMLNRIKWSENTLPLSNTAPTTFTGPTNPSASTGQRHEATWLNPMGDGGELKDLANNGCRLVWEGEERGKVFKRWYSRVCETDGEAREVLRRSGMENMWTLGRSLGAVEE